MNTAVTPGDDEIRRVPTQARCGGEWVQIGLDEYRMAPINLEVIRSTEFKADFEMVQTISSRGFPTDEQLAAAQRVIHRSMVRNYPHMPFAEVAAIVDLGNTVRVLGAALGVSGYVNGKAAAPMGEARASTGTASTAP